MRKWNSLRIVKLTVASLILSLALIPILGISAEVWSDDFDDQDYGGWTVQSGGFSCINGCLECTEDSAGTIGSKIWHPDNINSGTWSFDGYFVGGSVLLVYFWCSEGSTAGVGFAAGFNGGSIVLNRIGTGQVEYWVGGSDILLQWVHLDVTLDASFAIDIYVDGTHVIHYQAIDPLVTCEYLGAGMNAIGNAIDNVVVSDTIDVDCTNDTCTLEHAGEETTTTATATTTTTSTTTEATPPPAPTLPIEMIAIAGGVVVVLIVLVVILKRK